MSYLDRYISVVPRATEHRPMDHITVRQALEQIRTGKYKSYVQRVRNEEDKERRRKIKASGPAYTFSGHFTYVDREGLQEHTGLVCLDYDDVSPEQALEVVCNSEHVLAAFRSVSGGGLKVLVPVEPAPVDNDQHRQAYEQAAALWSLKVDRAASDISRLCYTSYDPDIYIHEAAVPVAVRYGRKPASRTAEGEAGKGIEIDVLPDGEKYLHIREVLGLLRHAGYGRRALSLIGQTMREMLGETPGDPEPIEKLVDWLMQKPPGLVPISQLRAEIARQTITPDDIKQYVITPPNVIVTPGAGGLSQPSQCHKHPPNGSETAISKNGHVTKRAVDVTIESARTFVTRQFPPVTWIVPGVLPEGLAMLAGKPKTGKSFLAVNIAVAVATGGRALGKVPVDQGRVLYINADSSPREFQTRIKTLTGDIESPCDLDLLELAFAWPRLDEGGLDALAEYIEENEDLRLIVIDTFKKIRPPDNHKKRLYDQDYESLDGLATLARGRSGLCIKVVHHANKLRDVEDPFDMISGSTGLTAALDTGIVLRHIPEGVALFVRGKEISQREYAITFDQHVMTWCLEGELQDFTLESTWTHIRDAIEAGNSTPRDIADFTGIRGDVVRQTLVRMAAAGKVRRLGRGSYALPRKLDFTQPDDSPF